MCTLVDKCKRFSDSCVTYFFNNKHHFSDWNEDAFGGGVSKSMKFGRSVGVRNSKVKKGSSSRRDSRKSHWILDNGLPYIKNTGAENPFPKNLKTDGVNSISLKKHPIRNSTRRQHFTRAPIRSLEMFHKYEKVFKTFEIDISRAVNCKGCWETNRHTLQRQLIPESFGTFSDLPDASSSSYFDESVKNVLRKLKIDTLCTCDIDDLDFLNI